MAITLRLNSRQEKVLSQIAENIGEKTKSKAIQWLIENINQIERDRLDLSNKLVECELELKWLKKEIREYMEAKNKIQSIEDSWYYKINE